MIVLDTDHISILKIAAICLVNRAMLLSRNAVDFEQVPGLRVEDWLSP